MEAVKINSTLRTLSAEAKKARLLNAEKQIENAEFISSTEAHRIMRSHILGLD